MNIELNFRMNPLKHFAVLICLALSGCGQRAASTLTLDAGDAQIINGELVNENRTGAAKSLVLLKMLNASGKMLTMCSAALIDVDTVLTAAHCFDPKYSPGLASIEIKFSNRLTDVNVPVRVSTLYASHPKYNSVPYRTRANVMRNGRLKNVKIKVPGANHDHDIALVHFKGGLPTGFVAATIDTYKRRNLTSAILEVYGYGRSLDYDVAPTGDFNFLYGTLRVGAMQVASDFDSSDERFHLAPIGKTVTCQGDSGGPSFLNSDEGPVLVGVNSGAGEEIAVTNKAKCFTIKNQTRVANFGDWIRREIRAFRRPARR